MEDKELVALIVGGDQQAFRLLIKRYQRLVGHMVARLIDDERDREEVAQDIFIKIYQKLSGFEFNSKLSTWIATISYRHAVNHLKKNKKWQNEEDIDSLIDPPGVLQEELDQQDYTRFVHNAVDQLPMHYRTVLTLYHLEGMSYPEIVEIMEMPEGTVKNYLFRARKKLKDLLEGQLNVETLAL